MTQNIVLEPGTYKIMGLIPGVWVAVDNAEAKVAVKVK